MRPPAAVATLGRLAELSSKMAHGIVRYCDNVVVVVDDPHAGRSLRDILPYVERDVPIVATLDEAVGLGVRELVIGASPPGGEADPALVQLANAALERGLWVVHGMHTSLVPMVAADAADRVLELRRVPTAARIASGAAANVDAHVVLTVGSDCATGKMTTALECWRGLRLRGRDAAFVATGQTAMYIVGSGAPIDAVTSDFAAGVAEELVVAVGEHEFVVVEGQGSLLHPAYSGVTLSLMHGAAPRWLVFCHELGRDRLEYFDRAIIDLAGQISLYEQLASAQRPCRVVAVAVMARGLSSTETTRAADALADELRLPVVIPRTEPDRIVDVLAELVPAIGAAVP